MATAVVAAVALSACGDDDVPEGASTDPEQAVARAEAAVADAQEELVGAHDAFCSDAAGYLGQVDRYGKVMTDGTATVGDVTTAGADLAAPLREVRSAAQTTAEANEALVEAEQQLADAQARQAEAAGGTAPSTTTTVPLLAEGTVDRVEQAERELTEAAEGVDDDTPVVEAATELNAAAVALEVAWLQMLDDADCLTDDQRSQASVAAREHTTAVQAALAATGRYAGEVDGVYGPSTVAAVEELQSENGLPTTGFVDKATADALAAEVATVEQATGDEVAAAVAGLQTLLGVAGCWSGPVDGIWSDGLTEALQACQVELGVEPTGVLDAPTIAAIQGAIADVGEPTTSTSTTSTQPDEATDTSTSSTTAAP